MWSGVLVGLVGTVPLLAIFYAGWSAPRLPFTPLALFAWLTRRLPGGVVTAGIDGMVRVITRLHIGRTDLAAKRAETAAGLVLFVIVGALVAAVVMVIVRRRARRPVIIGAAGSVLFAVVMAAVSWGAGGAAAAAGVLGALWMLACFVAWGVAIGWACGRLTESPAPAAGHCAAADEPNAVVRLDRRRFLLQVGGTAAVITVLGTGIGSLLRRRKEAMRGERWSERHRLPNAGAAPAPASGTRPEYTPLDYQIDIDTVPPEIAADTWRLKVGGLVEQERALTLEEIRGHEAMDQFVALSCISNKVGGDLIGTTRWTGVSLQKLLPEFGLRPEATHLQLRAADGFYETVALRAILQDRRVMLAYAWDGVPLPVEHGFPLRIYVPNRYGMKQPKWIVAIEAIQRDPPGYWVVRGWSRNAIMKATSVIDTVAVEQAFTDSSGRKRVPIGGIAHAGDRGISAVEVRVDDGAWEPARLRPPLSKLTWVVWRYDWPFAAGEYRFAVRCRDGLGTLQIEAPSPPHPSGATGSDRRTARL